MPGWSSPTARHNSTPVERDFGEQPCGAAHGIWSHSTVSARGRPDGRRRAIIQPGKPNQNADIERFNRTYRTEVPNAHLFESIAELQSLTRQWLRIYNQERRHDSLGRVPPLTFLPRPTTAGQSAWELSA